MAVSNRRAWVAAHNAADFDFKAGGSAWHSMGRTVEHPATMPLFLSSNSNFAFELRLCKASYGVVR